MHVEHLERLAHGQALVQRIKLGPRQRVVNRWQRDEDNLYRLAVPCLQVAEQPQLLEQIRRQALGLVEDDDRALPLGEFVEQVARQREPQFLFAEPLVRLTEVEEQRAQQVGAAGEATVGQ